MAKAIDSIGVKSRSTAKGYSNEQVRHFLQLIGNRSYPVEVDQVKYEVVKLYNVEAIKLYDTK